jgi:hypothetical protein
MQHPASEVPSGLKEFQYYQGLDPTTRAAYEKFLQITHPAMMAPITLGPNDTYDPGGYYPGTGSGGGGDITATGPNGEKVRYNPQTHAWEPMNGGQSGASPTGGFPR